MMKYLYRRTLLVIGGLAVMFFAPIAADTFGLGLDVSPAKLEISVPPGQTYNIPVTVHNSNVGQTHVQASMVDFGVSSSGSYQYEKVGTREYSLMKWASIRPREFDLPATTSQQVQLTISVPDDAHLSGEYAGIVFFQTRPLRGAPGSVAFSARVASKIYETIPGTVDIAGEITKMSSTKSSRAELYRVLFKNTGNAHVYLRGQVTIQKSGQQVDQIDMPAAMLVERGGERLVEVSGKQLPPGEYQAVATIDYGGKTETGGEIAFTI